MRGYTNLPRRHTLMAIVMIIFASCGPDSAAAQEAVPTDRPARVVELWGETAIKLIDLGFKKHVLVAADHAGVVVVLFAKEQGDIPALREELLVADIPDCDDPEGAVQCCNEAKGTVALFTTDGWADLGEDCGPSPPPDDQAIVESFYVEPGLSQELSECCGINSELMLQTMPNGKLRQLVNPPPQSQEGDSWLPPLMLQRSAFKEGSPIILAQNCPTTAPPSCCGNTPKRCHSTARQLWLKVSTVTGPKWCPQPSGCTCPPSPCTFP